LLIALCAPLIAACVPPKVLVSNDVIGPEKTAKSLTQRGATVVGAGKNSESLFDLYLRVCDTGPSGDTNCKDTAILENVVPQSIY
jgi:hypothetical protein